MQITTHKQMMWELWSWSITAAIAVKPTLHASKYVLAGVVIPEWLAIIIFFIGLAAGSYVASAIPTSVDKYVSRRRCNKIIIGMLFGFFSCIAIAKYFPKVDVLELALPAFVLSALGMVIMYYLIALFSSPDLWQSISEAVKNRLIAIINMIGGNK